MPSASDELREQMNVYFGDPISEQGPENYLKQQGYKLTSQWFWIPKDGVTTYEDMTEKEYHCILFLVHEWYYGGFDKGKSHADA